VWATSPRNKNKQFARGRKQARAKKEMNTKLNKMKTSTSLQARAIGQRSRFAVACMAILCISPLIQGGSAFAQTHEEIPGAAGDPYPSMPTIAPLGVRIGKHLEVPESSKGPTVDPAKGYRIQDLGDGLYMVTDNGYQSMFLVYSNGVVVVDAPPSYSQHIPQAIAEVTDKPITHVIYTHSHADHIGGTKGLGGNPIIIAHE
jgi:hypothetical protein